jgi:hypothetical protein
LKSSTRSEVKIIQEKTVFNHGKNAAVESAAEWLVENYKTVSSKLFPVGIGEIAANPKNFDVSVPLCFSANSD